MTAAWVNDLRRAYETLVAIRSMDGVPFAEWDALITASAVVRVELDRQRAALADLCAPWFEVRQ